MEIHKPEFLAQRLRFRVALMIAWQHPKLFSQCLEYFAAFVEAAAERRKITHVDVQVRWLSHNLLECSQIPVDIAEQQHFHCMAPFGAVFCAGSMRLMSCINIPFCSHPSST